MCTYLFPGIEISMGEYNASFYLQASQIVNEVRTSSQIDAFSVKDIKHASKSEATKTKRGAVEVNFHRLLYI
jgi:hypothetical protein